MNVTPYDKSHITNSGADLGLFAGGVSVSRSHMSSTYEPGGGRHMYPFTYVKVNVSWLLILQSLRLR